MHRSWLRLFWLFVVLVAAIGGYIFSTGLGDELLHDEIESQLSRIVGGEVEIGEVEIRWRDGVTVVGREVAAFPSEDPNRPPAIRARRVRARVDRVALLVGRIELSDLVLEGPHLRLARTKDGGFDGLPFPPVPLGPDFAAGDENPIEAFFQQLTQLESAADELAQRLRIADRIEVIDGTLHWQPAAETASSWRLELLNAVAEWNWLSDEAAVGWHGVFVDGTHAPVPFATKVRRDDGQPFEWAISVSQLPLKAAESPLSFTGRLSGLTGSLDAEFTLIQPRPGTHQLAVSGRIDEATIRLRRSGTIAERESVDIKTTMIFDHKKVELVSARLDAAVIGLEFKGELERPIRNDSPMRLESRVQGIEFDGLRKFVRSLENESEAAFTLSRFTERVYSGSVQYIEAGGHARLDRWQRFLSGELNDLPDGFVFGGAFAGVTVLSRTPNDRAGAAGGPLTPDDRIEDLRAEIEWVGDRIEFRNCNARFRGAPLPEINAVIDGLSHLTSSRPVDRNLTKSPPPVPGLGPLSEIIKPRNPNALPPVSAIGLAIDFLEHPVLRWPLRNARVLVEPLRRGVQVTVREGVWGGAGVAGELVWFDDPAAPSLSAQLTLSPGPAPAPATEDAKIPAHRWGQGQFELAFRPKPWLPFQEATGHFRLDGTDLVGHEIQIAIEPEGRLAARLSLGLETEASVGFDTSFALTEGRLGPLSPFIALPEDLATGEIGATGSLQGRLVPETGFISDLVGRVRAEAKDGHVFTSLPLMFRLAKATEGFNPFANADELHYEAMNGTFALDHGILSVPDFQIEGPLRVFARAEIDTNLRPATIDSVVGIFLFRKPNQVLEQLPILRFFLPGSDRGLIGTYFDVVGPLNEPEVEALPLQSLMSGVPSAIKAPFKALRFLFDRSRGKNSE